MPGMTQRRLGRAAVLALLLGTAASGGAAARDFGGEWTTSEGPASMIQRDGEVTGTYVNDNGRISGTVRGGHFSGYWGEDITSRNCGSERLGTVYWGRMEWDLAPDRNSFTGKYSYCADEPGPSWTGERIGAPPDDYSGAEGWNVPGGGEAQVTADNFNPARCDYTDFATIEANRPMFLNKFQLWVDWDRVPADLRYRVALDGRDIGGGRLERGQCDPYQTHWCNAEDSPNVKLVPGRYTIRLEADAICQNAGSNGEGFIRVFDP